MGREAEETVGIALLTVNNVLIDTNVFIDYLRKDEEASRFLHQTLQPTVSVITSAELVQGARDKQELVTIQRLIRRLNVLPVTASISAMMLSIVEQHTLSHRIAIPDALIAATAIEHHLTLVTANTKHFSFIKGLKIKPWPLRS